MELFSFLVRSEQIQFVAFFTARDVPNKADVDEECLQPEYELWSGFPCVLEELGLCRFPFLSVSVDPSQQIDHDLLHRLGSLGPGQQTELHRPLLGLSRHLPLVQYVLLDQRVLEVHGHLPLKDAAEKVVKLALGVRGSRHLRFCL